MENQSRMERNKQLHQQVRKEIAYKQDKQDVQSVINATFEKLKKIDSNYFAERLQYFDKKHEIEKPYLDKDRSSSLISDELKYDIRRDISELKKIKVKDNKDIYKDEKEETDQKITLKSQKFIDMQKALIYNENNFEKNIAKLREKQKNNKVIASQDISAKTVQQIRSQDNRSVNQMLAEVYDKNDKGQQKLQKTWKILQKSKKTRILTFMLLTLIIVMISAIIVPIFI